MGPIAAIKWATLALDAHAEAVARLWADLLYRNLGGAIGALASRA